METEIHLFRRRNQANQVRKLFKTAVKLTLKISGILNGWKILLETAVIVV